MNILTLAPLASVHDKKRKYQIIFDIEKKYIKFDKLNR